jgi:polyferredoxin/tetratricopeptide (TPR) repeat protein
MPSADSATRCARAERSQRLPISLDVLATDHEPRDRQSIARSRSGPRRAIVLAVIQLLMIAHIAMWLLSKRYGWFGGATLTPIEPSESMEFTKHGVVNAGMIFFCLALLSTLVLGRWFCGWGCHVVMLQDFCGWLMKQCGIRPKPFRSRLLMWVPLLLALYMFIWPAAYRLGMWAGREMGFAWAQTPLIPWEVHAGADTLTTTDFWRTFPGALVAVPFLLVCGFATVYFLGAKGFCTYGCPYGGFFAPLDRLAPGRILVTDACEGCGHCTAVCTSNVRVHEEVRDFGMVVDQGCMKCLDCVSVCPKEALYFGFAAPPGLGGVRTVKQRSSGEAGGRSTRVSWLARWRARPMGRVRFDLSWREEIGLALGFAASFFAVRGSAAGLPLLFAAGTAGVTSYLAWKLSRVVRDENANLHRFILKARGELRPVGFVFAAMVMLVIGWTAIQGATAALLAVASRLDDRVSATMPFEHVYTPNGREVDAQLRGDLEAALALYRWGSSLADGGLGFWRAHQTNIDVRCAWLFSCRRDFEAAQAAIESAMQRDGETEMLCRNRAVIHRLRVPPEQAALHYRDVLARHPQYESLRDEYVTWLESVDQLETAFAVAREGLDLNPDSLLAMRRLSILEITHGDAAKGIEIVRRTLEIAPGNANAYYFLALGLGRLGDQESAVGALREAVRLAPGDVRFHRVLAELLTELGRTAEAAVHFDAARALGANQ